MSAIQQRRGLRFVFAANVISMLGSGMNSAAVAWTVLERTHSEMALGTFAVVRWPSRETMAHPCAGNLSLHSWRQ